jgi:hypothetical protein
VRLRSIAVLGLAGTVLAAAGCGGDDGGEQTPVACLDGAGAYVGALGNAPGEVKLSGEVPVSDCLAQNQGGGDLAAVGAAMVAAATELNAEARESPGGDAALRLGYLVGAAERGAAETEGIHADLIRRLTAAAGHNPGGDPLPPAFRSAYRSGYAAGQSRG